MRVELLQRVSEVLVGRCVGFNVGGECVSCGHACVCGCMHVRVLFRNREKV